MAVFKVPRITTQQRQGLLLEIGEVVFDTDQKIFYGGDGVLLGGFLIGKGAGSYVDRVVLTEQDIQNKYITLNFTPLDESKVILTPEGGISQVNGVDFEISGNNVIWDGLGLDNFLEVNDVLVVQY